LEDIAAKVEDMVDMFQEDLQWHPVWAICAGLEVAKG